MATRSWLRKLFAPRTPRTIRKAPARRLHLESLEDRLLLSGGPDPIGQILPLYPPGATPYGVAQPDLPAAEATGFYRLILGRTPDASEVKWWAALLQGGASPGDVARGFLASREYQASLVEHYYGNFLNRSAEQLGFEGWAGALGSDTDTTRLTIGITTSAEYQGLYPTNTAFVQSLYANILGREGAPSEVEGWAQSLAGGASRAQVALGFATSTESLTQSVQEFYQVFFQRSADAPGLAGWVERARTEPLSRVLGEMLSSPEFQFRAAAGTAEQAFSNFFGFNQQALASDPVTDPVTSGGEASPAPVRMDSPWGQSLVFPSVPYDLTATGTAAQPTLQLPSDLVSSLNVTKEGTFQFWFQAKNPGVLLSATIPDTGATLTGSYPAPLIYINASGNLVAGLFDQTKLSVVPYQNPLSWKDADGPTQIGAAHPLVSQVGVLDNTWHHVALAFSAQSEDLYVDGMLQGTAQPEYYQTNAQLKAPNSKLVVQLDQPAVAGTYLRGTVEEASPGGGIHDDFGPGTTQIATFAAWLSKDGKTDLEPHGTSGSSLVQSATYTPGVGNSPGKIEFDLSGPISGDANALTVKFSYFTKDSAYSFKPAPTTWSTPVNGSTQAAFGDPTGLTVGGTIFPEPASKLHPATNYPQGFVGAVNEVALWDTMLTQPQVQSAMSGPVLPTDGSRGLLPGNLVGYFPFSKTRAGSPNEWPNEAPGARTFATGPTKGTVLTSVGSTIPTDPFPDATVTRLPGFRAWGVHLMTPLATPVERLYSGETYEYKVGLAAGDRLAITVPESPYGSLNVSVEDDLGRTMGPVDISAGYRQYLVAGRTGTYKLTLKWTSTDSTDVAFGLIPGPLNSVMELFSSYVQRVSPEQTNTVQAYSDPTLPGIYPTVGTDGPANYWPLWSDTTYFPHSATYGPADLQDAYKKLVNNNGALSDFANINKQAVTNPTVIQSYLDQGYRNVNGGKAPPTPPPTPPGTPPGTPPFPVKAAPTALDAVYEFFYNANWLREKVYSALTAQGTPDSPTSLQSWVQLMIDKIDGSTVPLDVATDIATGQAQQVEAIHVNIPEMSRQQSVGQILVQGLIQSSAAFLAAAAQAADLGPLAGALIAGGITVARSFESNAYASGAGTVPFTVPVTSLTNSVLNYANLSRMANSIQKGAQQFWTSIQSALMSDAFVQSVLSNFGLLKAFSVMSGAPLGYDAAKPADAVQASLKRSSWQEMIPATFTWAPVAPEAFPTGNGQTNDWAAAGPYPLPADGPDLNGITSADFNNDHKLDLAVANYGTNDVSILLGNGDGTFQTATRVGLNDGAERALGITSGDFNGDGNPDIVVSNYKSDDLSILLGIGDKEGDFQPARQISLSPPNEKGPDGPWGIVSGNFRGKDDANGKPILDLAVADYDTGRISILSNDGKGYFTAHTLHYPTDVDGELSGAPTSIATGDFDHDGHLDLAVASEEAHQVPYDFVSIWRGDGNGGFQYVTAPHGDPVSFGPLGVVFADLNGDHFADVATPIPDRNLIEVAFSNGDGTFHVTDYSLPTGSDRPTGIALQPMQPTDGVFPNLVVTCTGSNTVDVLFNQGHNWFLPAIRIPVAGNEPAGITVADFAGNGLGQAAIANNKSNTVVVLSPTGVGNTATFLPGPSVSSPPPLSGPTNLEDTVDKTALDKLLSQMQALQGGYTALFGPFDQRGLVTPSGITPPNFMAFTSLTYPPDPFPLSLNAPGMFLSLTPATLKETAKSGGTDLSYTQNGAYLAGWQLLDHNNNPIAPGTVQQLFGTQFDPQTGRPVGAGLTPVNPGRPFAAFNGGWYFDAKPVNGAQATWADAFFDWGLGTSDKGVPYSPRNLSPQVPLIGRLPNTSTPNVSNADVAYTLTFQPATDRPPAVGVPVDLGSSFNRMGIVKDGSVFSPSGGIDLAGNALSGTLLGGSVIANGARFTLGPPGRNNVVSTAGQRIPLPGGSFSNLNLLGLGLGGNRTNLQFTVRYTDGTTGTFTQSMSDWFFPKNNPNETIAATMPYRDVHDGTRQSETFNVYAYPFALNPAKTVDSIALPNDANAIVLAITLA
jgi:hypothetical protein